MRRLFLLALLILAVPVALFLVWDTQTRALGNALIADLSAAKTRVITRNPPQRSPLHDNGYQCLGSMLDVSPLDFGPFSSPQSERLEGVISGQRPASDLTPELRSSMVALSPWAASMRDCGDSAQLSWVEGLTPWEKVTHPRRVRFEAAISALIEFTAVELRVLLADGQPEVALERCGATWAMVADQSHLGLFGATYAQRSVRRLAPACGQALAAASPEVRQQVAKQWAPLGGRLANSSELIEGQRLATTLEVFAWVSGKPIRERLGASLTPGLPDLVSRVRLGRRWRAWDAAMRELVRVADAGGAERVKASAGVDEILEAQYERRLSSYEEAGALLEVLTEAAAGGSKPLPPSMRKYEKGLEFTDSRGEKVLIPLPPGAP